ncbi:hypothetical protein ACHELS_002193 [Vibrio vulnificus]|nr:hypothetical protein [Vibrio vulnificus]
MQWWESILESGGELIGGAVDLINDITPQIIQDKLNADAVSNKTANPSENRNPYGDYQQPNGDVVRTTGQGGNMPLYLTMGGSALLIAVTVYLAVKKG